MAEFVWRAADGRGQVSQGRIEAPSLSGAMKALRERGLTPLKIEDAASASAIALVSSATTGRTTAKPRQAKGPVNQADVLAMTSELSIMLKAGLPLDNALRVLIDMSQKPSVSAMQQVLLDDVKSGMTFSKALAKDQALFGDFYINMIRSGEASGQMSAVLVRLVEHMERLRALRESAVSATMYPAILLGVAVLSVIAMLGFVVPQFEKLFTDMGDALPLPTQIVMMAGHGFKDYGLIIGIVVAALIWLGMRWLKSPKGKMWWQKTALGMPVLGNLLQKYELTLFSRSLGTLLGNGVPMLTALHIATETVGNGVLRQSLLQVAPYVKEGGKIVEGMRKTQIFEPMAINLIRVGEETGRIGPMMLELANILNREVEIGIKRGLTLLEPALILVLGLVVASIIVSILLGILSVNDLAV
ncbi:MAG: type II secretion system F family protein [Betaproteobacteria bacterium]|jgi:general secretion pathway protein F|nr:type II secretion system F family protein [Betaproteobacteria bacterium]